MCNFVPRPFFSPLVAAVRMGKQKGGRAKGVDVTKDFVTGSHSLSETITVFVENNKPVTVSEKDLLPTAGSEGVFGLRRSGKLDAYMKLCSNWSQGQCHNNEQCCFAHVKEFFNVNPPLSMLPPTMMMMMQSGASSAAAGSSSSQQAFFFPSSPNSGTGGSAWLQNGVGHLLAQQSNHHLQESVGQAVSGSWPGGGGTDTAAAAVTTPGTVWAPTAVLSEGPIGAGGSGRLFGADQATQASSALWSVSAASVDTTQGSRTWSTASGPSLRSTSGSRGAFTLPRTLSSAADIGSLPTNASASDAQGTSPTVFTLSGPASRGGSGFHEQQSRPPSFSSGATWQETSQQRATPYTAVARPVGTAPGGLVSSFRIPSQEPISAPVPHGSSSSSLPSVSPPSMSIFNFLPGLSGVVGGIQGPISAIDGTTAAMSSPSGQRQLGSGVLSALNDQNSPIPSSPGSPTADSESSAQQAQLSHLMSILTSGI
jgi:hypothetical protein